MPNQVGKSREKTNKKIQIGGKKIENKKKGKKQIKNIFNPKFDKNNFMSLLNISMVIYKINVNIANGLDNFIKILEDVKGIKVEFTTSSWIYQILKDEQDILYPVYIGFIIKLLLLSNNNPRFRTLLNLPQNILLKYDRSYHEFLKNPKSFPNKMNISYILK